MVEAKSSSPSLRELLRISYFLVPSFSLLFFLWEIAVWCCWIFNGLHHFTGRSAPTCFAGETFGTRRLSCHTFISSLPLYPPPRGSHMQMCPPINISWLQTSNDLESEKSRKRSLQPSVTDANILCSPAELQAWAKLCCLHTSCIKLILFDFQSLHQFCCESWVVILCFFSASKTVSPTISPEIALW